MFFGRSLKSSDGGLVVILQAQVGGTLVENLPVAGQSNFQDHINLSALSVCLCLHASFFLVAFHHDDQSTHCHTTLLLRYCRRKSELHDHHYSHCPHSIVITLSDHHWSAPSQHTVGHSQRV